MIPVELVFGIIVGIYFAGWLHGRGTSQWTLEGYTSRRLRDELERREAHPYYKQ